MDSGDQPFFCELCSSRGPAESIILDVKEPSGAGIQYVQLCFAGVEGLLELELELEPPSLSLSLT
ncbi:hypothetical protein AMTR_s00142p00085000 [Amborella trichopoda]|uniref:Uncharacterized protein n=1 Tax=Amborella trichopoda TaxID=13333 RepID=W1P851_AMBTC|nr:hypothetical protein AMTR_s00142p00085000 [Amborella trichopoda]